MAPYLNLELNLGTDVLSFNTKVTLLISCLSDIRSRHGAIPSSSLLEAHATNTRVHYVTTNPISRSSS